MSFTLSATSTSITFHVTPVDGYGYYRLFLRPDADTSNMIVDGLGFSETSAFTYTVTGEEIKPSTKYAANVYYKVANGSDDDYQAMGTQTVTTKSEGDTGRPEDWAWTTNIVKGATVPLSSYGYLAPVSAVEWNGFCARINEFRAYAGLDEYTFTTVSSNYPITWAVVNEVKTAIGGISGSGTLPTSTNPIEAAFYIQLASALNEVP